MREYKRNWVRARREEFFKDKACADCGSTERLELDHIDPREKIHHAIWSWRQERRKIEIAKCQVLCHDCHKVKTIEQMFSVYGMNVPRHGSGGMARKCTCGLCRLYKRNMKRASRKRLGTTR